MLDVSNINFCDFYFNGHYLSDFGGFVGGRNGLETYSGCPAYEYTTDKPINYDGLMVFDSHMLPREFTVPVVFDNLKNIRSISGWLCTPTAKPFFFKNDTVYINAMINEAPVDFERLAMLGGTHDIEFIAHDPYFYQIEPDTYTYNFTSSGTNNITFVCDGNTKCFPKITLYGSGNFILTVADADGVERCSMSINGISKSVTLDALTFTVYEGTINKLYNTTGDFNDLYFSPGNNMISITGACTKAEIAPRLRWI